MAAILLDKIPFTPQPEQLLAAVRLRPERPEAEAFLALLNQAQEAARPKALYLEAYVEERTDETVTIGGVTFHSRMLRMNLEHAGRIFPFVATCGSELDSLPLAAGDFLGQFWLDAIKAAALHDSYQALLKTLESRYALVKTASMNPGSGDVSVWPIEQQRELFALLGDVWGAIRVELTESYLMRPNKTISGVIFPTEKAIRTCQVCHRENCPSRQAPFDRDAWEAIQ
jgi:hypothetical protein